MPQLICQDLALGYDGKALVSGLSFSVGAGDYLCVVGDNGSGKSTLMKTILKLMPPISGKISMCKTERGGAAHAGIGYLPQQAVYQKDFPASVREVVRTGCLNRRGIRPFYSKHELQLAEDNIQKTGVAAFAKQCYSELSVGQRQRALLARAMCAARTLLLLDEPAAGLDQTATAEMYATIKDINDSGTTIIMISHDITGSLSHASHILHIGAGKMLFYGAIADYVGNPAGCDGGNILHHEH